MIKGRQAKVSSDEGRDVYESRGEDRIGEQRTGEDRRAEDRRG
jgi:hypothetical protein